ncbi:MAG: ABC transporter ATP-binding protein [Pseudomonadota bacterium]
MSEALLQVEGLTRRFGGERRLFGGPAPSVQAVRDIDLDVRIGETLGIVGESGCGKSTLARMLVGLDRPSEGMVRLDNEVIQTGGRGRARPAAATIQYVFQDPVSSLNPRKTIRAILMAPMIHLLGLSRERCEARLKELMDAVNLREEFLERYPHEFSGGQAQRIGIARALAAEPRIIVLDEPVSALDVSVQAQVLNLLAELKARFALTYVFISHDLAVVETISDRVAVMYFGRIVELAPAAELFRTPRHPYTRLLLESAPVPGRRQLAGEDKPIELPDPYAPMPGCAFASRCPRAIEDCGKRQPALEIAGDGQAAACFNPLDGPQDGRSQPR